MLRTAVCVSGGGTNLQVILDSLDQGRITNTEISLVVSNKPDAYALTRAEKHGIRTCVVQPRDYPSREAFGEALNREMQKAQIDLVVLAGYLVILPENFVTFLTMYLSQGKSVLYYPQEIGNNGGKNYERPQSDITYGPV